LGCSGSTDFSPFLFAQLQKKSVATTKEILILFMLQSCLKCLFFNLKYFKRFEIASLISAIFPDLSKELFQQKIHSMRKYA